VSSTLEGWGAQGLGAGDRAWHHVLFTSKTESRLRQGTKLRDGGKPLTNHNILEQAQNARLGGEREGEGTL